MLNKFVLSSIYDKKNYPLKI